MAKKIQRTPPKKSKVFSQRDAYLVESMAGRNVSLMYRTFGKNADGNNRQEMEARRNG